MKPLAFLLVAFTVAFGIAIADQNSGFRTYWQLRSEVAQARQRVAALELEAETLRREAELLKSDSFAIEQAIREDLGLARPGEVVVKLPGSESSPFLDAPPSGAEPPDHERTAPQ